ncbi:MAG: NAD(P)/FAD-dependent oxidoreductase [Archaeoglobaceae archaeon]|nr:NAD(P)/FAD-dependent oxidoreductase [Archaeoglobaceae archaeon]MDW8118418.1 NAD(P)/FAD-dependent oxidoreductase [Archaeoglobaceae archaeon]
MILHRRTPKKVLIAGGSIAGLECAIRFSNFSKVLLCEKKDEIGKNIRCGEGWINFTGIRPYISGRRVNLVDLILLNWDYSIRRVISVRINGSVEIVDRSKMEKRMAEIAEKNGAEIITGKKLGLNHSLNFGCDLLVDATGYPSMWCREFGGRKPHASAIHVITDKDEERIRLFLYPNFDGYFYVFPMANRGSKIGVCTFSTSERPLRQILDTMIEKSALFGDFERIRYSGGPIGCYRNSPFIRQFLGIPIALVGDAAGLADRFAAEGMTKAIISSRILAECAKNGRLKSYEKEYYRRMRSHYTLTRIFEIIRKRLKIAETLGKISVYDLVNKIACGLSIKENSMSSENSITKQSF